MPGLKELPVVPEQAVADPIFSTVKSPNPEDPAAFEYALRLREKIDLQIFPIQPILMRSS